MSMVMLANESKTGCNIQCHKAILNHFTLSMVIESKSTPQEFPDIEPGDLRARFGTPQKLRVSVIQMSRFFRGTP